ncbi:MAG: HAD family hydrolase [Candidatus Latescibacteria bacterium]|nr:HAD family hydrolase [Candidatus Latescibacterota bacterium]
MIFFDIDGTLLDHAAAERAGALALRERHPALAAMAPDRFVERWHALAEEYVDRFLAGELSTPEQRRARLRALFVEAGSSVDDPGADTAFAYYLERYEAAWRLYPDVAPCLAALEGDGHALGVISNGDSDAQRRKLERMGLADRLPTVAISGDIGVAKPAAALFEHACRLAGRAPADCLYIGDRLDTDARAARRAGLRGVFLDRNGVGAEDVPRIGSLAELPTLLSTLA